MIASCRLTSQSGVNSLDCVTLTVNVTDDHIHLTVKEDTKWMVRTRSRELAYVVFSTKRNRNDI